MRKYFVIGMLLFWCGLSKAQDVTPYGNYPIKSYRSIDFKAPGQILSTAQNDLGEMFFANNSGILTFNGVSWKKIRLGKAEAKISSIVCDQKGNIFFGGDEEIGYLIKDDSLKNKGKYKPVILFSKSKNIVKKNNDTVRFEKVNWVFEQNENVFFIGLNHYYLFNRETNKLDYFRFEKGNNIIAAYNTYNKVFLYAQVESSDSLESKILIVDEEGVKITPNHRIQSKEDYSNNQELTGVFQIKKNYYLFQRDGGVFGTDNIFNKEAQPVSGFKKDGIYEDILKNVTFYNDAFWFGTKGSGIIVFSKEGEYIRTINSDNGLTDLNIENSFIDRGGNLWLNYDKGIDILELKAPIRFYNYKTKFNEYVEKVYEDSEGIFLATRRNAYKINKDGSFIPYNISNSKAELYDFIRIEGDLLVIAFDGILKLNDDLTDSLVNELYAWVFEKSSIQSNVLYVGLDGKGVAKMTKIGGNWTQEILPGCDHGEVRSMAAVNGFLYFSVLGDGVYRFNEKTGEKILLRCDVKFEKSDGYVIENYGDHVVVGTKKGLFEVIDDRLVRFDFVTGHTDATTYVHRLVNDGKGRLWTILFENYKTENERRVIGYIDVNLGEYRFTEKAFKDLKATTVMSISCFENRTWFSGPEGLFYHEIDNIHTYNDSFQVLLDFAIFNTDSIHGVFNGLKDTLIEIPFANSFIEIAFAAPQYFGNVKNEYRYFLVGRDSLWSNWSADNDEKFTGLPHGKYVLKFQARNYYGTESDIKEIRFTILPPWYFTWWAYLLYFLGAILIIILVARLSVNRVKKQKQHLEEVVIERTSEIAEQNNQLEHQKAEIEEKSNDILDSIKYAERIQQTILPADEYMEEMFEEHFVLFRPKDIVSGDFYWAEVSKKMFLFSAIDCTGHGVPGAFVSIVGHNGLTRAIKEFGHSKPNDILDTLREIVIEAFKGQGKADVKDGMDVGLCGIDYDNLILHYAGANNPCIIIRNGEIHEIKADKQPIGQFEYGKPFTAHEFQLQKGDVIYVYTDGYIDQFGGEKGKKFKSRPFKNMLLEIVDLPMKEQHDFLNKKFDDWRGENEQIDDVCVFGVRV